MDACRTFCFPLLMAGMLGSLAACANMYGAPSSQAIAPPVQAVPGQPVPVTLVDYRIVMPPTVPAGVISFRVTNQGRHAHNFEIRGPAVSQRFATDLQPGETRLMQIQLAPGNYTVICPVDAHTALGMQTHLVAR